MTGPEFYFDERNPSDYRLFGIRHLITRAGSVPPVPARLALRSGPYALWTLPGGGVLHAGTIAGEVAADRTDIGTRTLGVQRSDLAQHDRYAQVWFGSGAPPRFPAAPPARSAGAVVTQADRLTAGRAAATVAMRRPGVVVLSASFDPGWTVTVDGRSQPTVMVAPALVATTVRAGTHRVAFHYSGFRGYRLLCALSAATLLALLAGRTRALLAELTR
jgi:hypothetical protein